MAESPKRKLPARLSRARERFEKWRSTRTKPAIPDPLWELATELAGRYGINQTARALRLDYYSLKRRVSARAGANAPVPPAPPEASPTFVEVHPSTRSSPSTCRVELEDSRGVKMRIELEGAGAEEIAALGQLFWRQRG